MVRAEPQEEINRSAGVFSGNDQEPYNIDPEKEVYRIASRASISMFAQYRIPTKTFHSKGE